MTSIQTIADEVLAEYLAETQSDIKPGEPTHEFLWELAVRAADAGMGEGFERAYNPEYEG
ncbi:hypothetical protein [Galactobacter valiniphilus]|uniref:hypothetical protein n=1 Tax=Galactobacter valiniphilus TaxID=2676122 RepID=UPI0037362133